MPERCSWPPPAPSSPPTLDTRRSSAYPSDPPTTSNASTLRARRAQAAMHPCCCDSDVEHLRSAHSDFPNDRQGRTRQLQRALATTTDGQREMKPLHEIRRGEEVLPLTSENEGVQNVADVIGIPCTKVQKQPAHQREGNHPCNGAT